MIEALSHRIALRLKETNPEGTVSVEVMSYALQGIIQNTVTVLTALVVSLFFGNFVETILAVLCFIGLRLVSGGYHFKSAAACFLFSTAVFILVPFLHTNDQVLLAINGLNLFLVLIFAPSNIKEHIRVPERYFIVFKLISVLLVTVNFFSLSSIVTFAFLAQTLSLVNLIRK